MHGIDRQHQYAIRPKPRIDPGGFIEASQKKLLESTLLALGGGAFGVALCIGGLRGLTAFHLPSTIPVDLTFEIDWRVLLYAFLMSVAAGVLCGLGPALAASRPVLPNSLKGESDLDRPGKQWSLRNILVMVQISLCLVLLCTTGLST